MRDRVDLPAVHVDRHEVRRRREVPVPDAVVHGLEVPDTLAGLGIETEQRFGEQVGARTLTAPVVATHRARGGVHEPPLLIECQGSPHVGVAHRLPRSVTPGIGAELLGRLWNRVEDPGALARADVERLNRSGRVVAVLQTIGDPAPDNHQISVHHAG